MYHIAICDDEEPFRLGLKKLITDYAGESGVGIKVSAYSDGSELLENYRTDIDLIFLDIKMEHVNGLKTAKAIRGKDSKVSIIFLTSAAGYALEGYKYQATNFIIKPIRYVRLKEELDRWVQGYRQEGQAFILVTNDTGKYKVFLNSLQYIETFGRNLMVHTEDKNIVTNRKMKELETELPPSVFVRCHTSYLISLLYVKRVGKLEVELTCGAVIPVSQPKRKLVMERLAEYWGDKL
ncbi:MAG: LytTR family DNA-binding domain-containing protein [Clostridiales bacterium]|nr:LytTR family DNA-binding domain-containing protein [Clostridiales bacterium]